MIPRFLIICGGAGVLSVQKKNPDVVNTILITWPLMYISISLFSQCFSIFQPIVLRRITKQVDRESGLSPPIFTFLVRLVRLAKVITAAKEEVRYR